MEWNELAISYDGIGNRTELEQVNDLFRVSELLLPSLVARLTKESRELKALADAVRV